MRQPSAFNLSCVFPIFCVLAVCVMAMVFSGCSVSMPQKGMVLNLAAQNSGFLLAKEESGLAKNILGLSEDILTMGLEAFSEPIFQVWAGEVMEGLKIDPFLQMNFRELLKLVDVEIQLSVNQQEITEQVFNVIRNFTIGIKAGLR